MSGLKVIAILATIAEVAAAVLTVTFAMFSIWNLDGHGEEWGATSALGFFIALFGVIGVMGLWAITEDFS